MSEEKRKRIEEVVKAVDHRTHEAYEEYTSKVRNLMVQNILGEITMQNMDACIEKLIEPANQFKQQMYFIMESEEGIPRKVRDQFSKKFDDTVSQMHANYALFLRNWAAEKEGV